MKIAVVSHFYPPEPCAAATRVASLVAALKRDGHTITVLTNFPSFPAARFAPGDRFCLRRSERVDGVTVVRLASIIPARLPGKRLVHWATSALSSTLHLLASRERFDAIVVSSPPITLAVPALAGAWRHQARLVVDVRDVFPDIAIAMGQWRADGVLARATEWVVRRLYRRADLIVPVTPTALEQIASRGIDPARLVLARNAAEIATIPEHDGARRDGFTAIYAGNLGLATDVDILVDAAARVEDDGITMEIVGGGAEFDRVAARLRDEDVRNVVLRGSVARDEALRAIANADVSIVPLRRGIKESVPTKLYDSCAVGRPVIVAAEGEAANEGAILGARCVGAGDADALARELRELARLNREDLRALGERGRAALQKRADRAGIMEGLARRIAALA